MTRTTFISRVTEDTSLILDLEDDSSHLVDNQTNSSLFYFDSSGYGYHNNQIVCKCYLKEGHWHLKNDLGIQVTPVSFNEMEGTFKVEVQFLKSWYQMHYGVNNDNFGM